MPSQLFTRRPLSLYLHIPFCDHKCSYCDFNSYAGQDSLIPAYLESLHTELALWAPSLGDRVLSTIFFGGGTPSLLEPVQVAQLLAAVNMLFAVDQAAEVTLEANPGTVDRARLAGFKEAGINRLSIGVQSFDSDQLRLLDRIHDAPQAEAAYVAAREAGFTNVNLDLMFGLQAQDATAWNAGLERAVALGPEHLSLYALTVEPGTALAAQVARGHAPEPDPDLQADMYESAARAMAGAGYTQYEISNWSRPNREARHNLTYWQNRSYLGVGAGAHSCLFGCRFATARSPVQYMERVRAAATTGRSPLVDVQRLTRRVDASDALILGLRLNEGVSVSDFADRFDLCPREMAGAALAELEQFGLIENGATTLRLTERGRLLSNEVFVRLLPDALTPPSTWPGDAFVDTASLPFLP